MVDRNVRLRPTYDGFEFERVVRTKIPGVVARAGMAGFVVLCDALELAVRKSEPDDGACTFRSAVEAHSQNAAWRDEPLSLLIDAVRDSAEQIALARRDAARDVLAELERREPLIFRRLALHVVRLFPDVVFEAVGRYLLDGATLDALPLWHERRLLERDGFSRLKEADQTAFLELVRQGPDVETFRQAREVTEAEASLYVRRWKRTHLALIASALPDDLRREYDEIVAELGATEHPDFLGWIGKAWVGPSAPATAADLEKLTLEEIFQLFRTFTPRPRFDGPFASRDGLSRELTKVIAKAPQLFAEAGMRFVEHAPPYVRALVEGLTEAVRAKLVFEWAPVLELSEWVLEQPTGEVLSLEQALDLGEDPGWTWTRMAVCRLLVAGLAEGPSTLPAVHDARVLRMLETLLAAADDSTMRDPLEHAMNTIRGTAAEGLLRWTLRQGGDVGGERFVASGASVLLERMLSAEPSVGPRAMVGVYLPYLIALDAAWVRAHYELLFPHEPGAGSARSAVWNTFVQRRDPDLASFRMLQAEYEREVRELAGFRGDKRRMEALVRHLVALYWSGHVPLDGGLLDRFYANADVSERQEVIKHIGACFFHTDGEIPRPMLERVCLLWERRLAAATTRPSPEGAAEVAEFGWWFASAKFDQGWSMAQLALVLDLTDEVELEYAVAERLGVLAEGAPSDAIRLLARLMARAKDWSAIACRRGIESTVRAVLASPEADAHAMARDLVGRLTARGHAEFLSLISP